MSENWLISNQGQSRSSYSYHFSILSISTFFFILALRPLIIPFATFVCHFMEQTDSFFCNTETDTCDVKKFPTASICNQNVYSSRIVRLGQYGKISNLRNRSSRNNKITHTSHLFSYYVLTSFDPL